jgi:phosphoribosylformylglycinamidine cyclo-ligase
MAVTYRDAGVDIDAADSLIDRIKPLARATRTAEVLEDVGGFAGLCSLPTDITDPVLVSGTDGVGTKLKLAFETGIHHTVGQDLVGMCVNDVATCGARPLFFLDYFATGKLDVDVAEQVIRGIADGCKLAGCALIGGETAELPGMYPDGEYDLAGFSVGVVSRSRILGPARVKVGDVVIGVASSGLHSNGYSLARKVIQQTMGLSLDRHVPELGTTVGEAMLVPTRIYPKAVQALSGKVGEGLHALCHVTGGGLTGNLPRVMPDGTVAKVKMDHHRPAIYDLIEHGGPVDKSEMLRTFNLGVGLVALVAADQADAAVAALSAAGERAWIMGEVVAGSPAAPAEVQVI